MKRLLVLLLLISLVATSTACSRVPAYDVSNVSEYVVDGSSLFAFDIFKALNNEDADKTSMHVILPDEGVDINKFINNMTPEQWTDIRDSLKKTDDVELKLPKFKLEYGIKDLNDSLISLGMESAFSDAADFSGINEGILISSVLHKAVIEVNEEGSEAAAATAVGMELADALEDQITFIADRPFVFLIIDDTTGTIMFMDKVLSI